MHAAKTELLVTDDYVAIDLETTGYSFNYCEPIEAAAVKVIGGSVVETFESLIKPKGVLPKSVAIKTGLTDRMLLRQPAESEVIPVLMDFIEGFPVLGHNVCFDVNFLNAAATRLDIGAVSPPMIDNLRISRLVLSDLSDYKQETVFAKCTHLAGGCEPFGHPHRSLTDAMMAHFNYEVMKPLLVEAYGDDPEEALSRRSRKRSRSIPVDPKAIVPTIDEINESGPLYNTHVCFTGKLSTMTRREAWQKVVNLGAIIDKGVTRGTDYLVVGSFDFCASLNGEKSSKLRKAETLAEAYGNPTIISEDFFSTLAEDA